jgi:ribonuclease BN (tRNA processing enzyme)
LRFTVLGSGTFIPDPERGPAGFLVQVGDRRWLVDGGTGTLRRCAQAGVDPRGLDGGFYTHRHPDHCADLVPLLFAMRVGQTPRTIDYPIWAGTGFADYVAALGDLYGDWIAFAKQGATVHELSLTHEDQVDLDRLRMVSRPAAHGAGALHLRFEADGTAVVFSGDTGPSEHLAELASRADLLVCECSFPDQTPEEGHLTPSQVAALADAARPREVWLTHLYPMVDPALAVATVAKTGIPVRRVADLDRWPPHRRRH